MKIAMLLDNPLSPDDRVLKEARSLVNAGYDVTVFCKKKEGLIDYENTEGIKIKRVFTCNLGTSILIDKYLSAHFELINTIDEKFDVYHCHDNETWPIGYILSKRDNAKFICDSHEYFPDYLMESTYMGNKRKYETAVISALNRGEYFKYADGVLTVSNSMAERFQEEYKLKTIPTVIYNTRPYNFRITKQYDLFREKYGIKKNKKILFFQGNIEPSRGLDFIIEALSLIKSDVLFLAAGKIEEEYLKYLKAVSEKYNVKDKFKYIGFLNPSDLMKYTASADLLMYYPRNELENLKLTVPNKFFDYIFASRPLIVGDVSEFKTITNKYNLGFCVSNVKEMSEKVDILLNDYTLYSEKTQNSIKSHKDLCWEVQEKKLLDFYEKVTANK